MSSPSDSRRLPARAGQFFVWRFLSGAGWTRGHPYSLSAAPDGRGLRISVKTLGDGSADLHRLRPGARVLLEGPFGRLSARARTRRKVALIGAGVGVTPLRALAEEVMKAIDPDGKLAQPRAEAPAAPPPAAPFGSLKRALLRGLGR